MNPILIIGGAAALLLLAGAAGERPKSPPLIRNAFGYYIPQGPESQIIGPVKSAEDAIARRTILSRSHNNASPSLDQYSKELYLPNGVRWPMVDLENLAAIHATPWLQLRDEFGRGAEGVGANPLKTFAGVTAMVLPYIPGVGTGASAVLGATIALGQGKSLQDAALAAGYYATPAHLRFAYSLGVGVVFQNQPIDQAALQAIETQYPGATAVYQKARKVAS